MALRNVLLVVMVFKTASCFMKRQEDCPKVEPQLDFNVTGITGTWYLIGIYNSTSETRNKHDFDEYQKQIPEITCGKLNIRVEDYKLIVGQNWIRLVLIILYRFCTTVFYLAGFLSIKKLVYFKCLRSKFRTIFQGTLFGSKYHH